MNKNFWIGLSALAILAVIFTTQVKNNYGDRGPASVDGNHFMPKGDFVTEAKLSKAVITETDNLNAKILGIKTIADLEQVLVDIGKRDEELNKVGTDGKRVITNEVVRLYAIVASVVPIFKGAIYRLRYIVEQINVLYAWSVTSLRKIKQSSSEYPKYMDVLFDYVTTPNPSEEILGQKGPFKPFEKRRTGKNEIKSANSFFQEYLISKIVPIIESKIIELEEVIANGDSNRPLFLYDLGLLIGNEKAKKLEDNLESTEKNIRHKIVLATHLKAGIANLKNTIGAMYYISSYDLDGGVDYLNKIAWNTLESTKTLWLTYKIGDLTDKNNLPSAKEKKDMFDSVRKKHPNFLKFKPTAMKGKKSYLEFAKDWFLDSIETRIDFYTAMVGLAQKSSSPKSYFLNADDYRDHQHEALNILNERKAVYESNAAVTLTDYLTKEEVKVNISKFFSPESAGDLGAFLPNAFDKEKKEIFGKGHDTARLNYNYKKIEDWPSPTLNGILPGNMAPAKKFSYVSRHPALPLVGAVVSIIK